MKKKKKIIQFTSALDSACPGPNPFGNNLSDGEEKSHDNGSVLRLCLNRGRVLHSESVSMFCNLQSSLK